MSSEMSQPDDLQNRAEAFADLSIKFVQGLPDHQIARRLGGQYLDASTSVAANDRSARRGKSYADFTAKIGTVSEEADESVFWLKRFQNAGIVSSAVPIDPLLQEAEELARIFGSSARTARRRRGGNK